MCFSSTLTETAHKSPRFTGVGAVWHGTPSFLSLDKKLNVSPLDANVMYFPILSSECGNLLSPYIYR